MKKNITAERYLLGMLMLLLVYPLTNHPPALLCQVEYQENV